MVGCARTPAEPNRSADVRLQDPTAAGSPGSCEGLDEGACKATTGCRVGEGQEFKDVDGGYCLADPSFAGCQVADNSGIFLPASAPSCSPDGRQFFFSQMQDTPQGWSQEFCAEVLDHTQAPPCEGSKPRTVTAEERLALDQRLAGDAVGSYQETLRAYRRGDHQAYLDGFAPELTCFYGETKSGRRALERARRTVVGHSEVYSSQAHLLRVSADEVVFIDYGFYSRSYEEDSIPDRARNYVTASDDPVEQGTHAKLVVMTKRADTWTITAETSRAHQDCVQPGAFSDPSKPQQFADCEAKHRAALKNCDAVCASPTPGHACLSCPDEAWCELKSCLFIKPIPGESCW